MNLHIHIKDINYIRKEAYGIVKTKCIIHWINPMTGNIQRSIGTTCKNPDDVDNNVLACRIAEGRAKINMWQDFQVSLINIKAEMMVKYDHLVNHEINHVSNLIKNN